FVAVGSSLCSVVGSYLSAVTGVGFGRDIRNLVFTQVESYSLHEFDRAGTASLITRTTNDITQVQNVLVMGLRFLVFAPIMCVGGVIMAFAKDRHLTLILLAILPFMLIFMGILATVIVPMFDSMQTWLDRVNLVLRENLTGIRV